MSERMAARHSACGRASEKVGLCFLFTAAGRGAGRGGRIFEAILGLLKREQMVGPFPAKTVLRVTECSQSENVCFPADRMELVVGPMMSFAKILDLGVSLVEAEVGP